MLRRAHRIRLKPTSPQVAYFVRCAGTSRYSYNWSLVHSDAYYREHKKTISDFDLHKVWNAHRKAALPWTYEVTKHTSDSGVRNFCAARKNWFADLKKKRPHFRRPKLKTKLRSKKSFTVHGCGTDFRVEGLCLGKGACLGNRDTALLLDPLLWLVPGKLAATALTHAVDGTVRALFNE